MAKKVEQSDFLRQLGIPRGEKKTGGKRSKKKLFGVMELSHKLAYRKRGPINNPARPDPILRDYKTEYDREVKADQQAAEEAGERLTAHQFDDWRTIVRYTIDVITRLEGKEIAVRSKEENLVFAAVWEFRKQNPTVNKNLCRNLVLRDLAKHRPK